MQTSAKAAIVAIIEPDIERLDKLETYFNHFQVEQRYELDFNAFVRKVDNGTWEAWLADEI